MNSMNCELDQDSIIRVSVRVTDLQRCEGGGIGWEKVTGMRPESAVSSTILYEGINSQGITANCFGR